MTNSQKCINNFLAYLVLTHKFILIFLAIKIFYCFFVKIVTLRGAKYGKIFDACTQLSYHSPK